MRRSVLGSIALLTLTAIVATPTQAGEIEQSFAEYLNTLTETDFASAIIYLADRPNIRALDRELHVERTPLAVRHERVVTTLRAAAERSQPALLSYLDARVAQGAVEGYTPYWILNMVVVSATKAELQRIAARPDVEAIEANFPVAMIEPVEGPDTGAPLPGIGVTNSLKAINAHRVWRELGYTGAGRLIGGLDTGVDGNHPALAARWRGNWHPWNECWHDALGTTQFPNDGHGHGTHTMGTMAGAGHATGDTVGVAFDALWIADNSINQGVGPAFDNDVLAAFQWFADPDGNPSTTDDVPDVVQNSWGIDGRFGYDYQDCDYRWQAAIENCEAAGVVVTFSAGNEGPGSATHRSPANIINTPTTNFSVGAVDGENYTFPFPIASFSSRGPSDCDGLTIKPEVVGPGVSVYSSYPGGSYVRMSGTSMAGPHVAGVVALMRQANPDADVQTIKNALMSTARDLGAGGEDNSYGWGVIDAYEAVRAVMNPCDVVADFTSDITSGCAPLTVNFTNLSTGTGIDGWSWTFGDGGTSTAQNPTYAYNSPGTYTVSLTATSSGQGCGDTVTKTGYITVDGGPVADFTGSPASGVAPLTVQFTDLSTGGPTGWSWSFGDGGTSIEQNPSYTYDTPGLYTVSLTVTGACGTDDEIKVDYINVTDPGSVVLAYAAGETSVAGTVNGDYTATHAGDNVYEAITEVTYTGHPRKRYSYLEHRWDFSVSSGSAVTFHLEAYRSTNSEGDNFLFEYSTDGSTWLSLVTVASATEQVYEASMPNDLSGIVTVRVTDTDRTWGSIANDTVTVDEMYIASAGAGNQPPVADFTGSPTSGVVPLTVQFTDLSTNVPTAWSWTFGDGGTSTDQNASYTYNTAGSYTVSLTASNAYGSDSETKVGYITVSEPGATMHVHDIVVTRKNAGPNASGIGTITIHDYNGQPVANATVYATATGPVPGTFSGLTGADGTVVFETGKTKNPVGEWCFEVTNVTHATLIYDPDSNDVTMACESGPVFGHGETASRQQQITLPSEFSVDASPNPFNPSTRIRLDLPSAAHVLLELFDVGGRRVAVLANRDYSAGSHAMIWNADGQSSGIYFYRATVGSHVVIKRLILMK